MRPNDTMLIVLLAGLACLAGCQTTASTQDSSAAPAPAPVQSAQSQPEAPPAEPQLPAAVPAPEPVRKTAVEQAIQWSQLYADALGKLAGKDRQISDLREEKAEIEADRDVLSRRVKQAEQELADANDLLVKMDANLEEWRESVLGFREEMRISEAAQMEALQKILSLLGAEVTEDAEEDTTGGAE